MTRTFLIGLDGTASGLAAAELAARWAAAARARLVGVAVVDEPGICRPESSGVMGDHFKHRSDERRLADARRAALAAVADFADLCERAGVPFEGREIVGDPAEVLAAEAAGADLLILSQHARFETEGVLERLLTESPVPVVTAPDRPPASEAVVVAYHAEPHAVRALHAFAASGLGAGRRISVVSVGGAEAARWADEAAKFLRHHDLDAEPHALPRHGSVSRALREYARSADAGLVVLGVSGRSRLSKFFLGSVTDDVIHDGTAATFSTA